jgi:hypothetical protein
MTLPPEISVFLNAAVFDIADNRYRGGRAHGTKVFAGPAPGAAFLVDRYVLAAASFLYEVYDTGGTVPRAGGAVDIFAGADADRAVYYGASDLNRAFFGDRYRAYRSRWADS